MAATKEVSFGTVQVRNYHQVIGDYPCGLSVQLDWSFANENMYSIERFELGRQGCRREGPQMILPRSVMMERLMAHGYSRRHLHEYIQQNSRQWKRNQRRAAQMLLLRSSSQRQDRLAETVETLRRRIQRGLSLVMKKKEESKEMGMTWVDTTAAPPQAHGGEGTKPQGILKFVAPEATDTDEYSSASMDM